MRTNAGTDWQANQLGGVPTGPAKYCALSANTSAPVATDTTLAGEITTAGGGLIRKAAAFGHTTGVASYTITGTFTATASDVLPVTLNKVAFFDASSGGNMAFEDSISAALVQNVGDQVIITQTVSI